MNRKQIIGTAVLVAVALAVGGLAQTTGHDANRPVPLNSVADQVGRYQLCSGHFFTLVTTKDGLREGTHDGLYKIDTTTGKVWEYVEGMNAIPGTKSAFILRGNWEELPRFVDATK